MASKFEIEMVLKSDVEKVWKSFKELTRSFPKALPNYYERIDVVEGDGLSVGTIFITTLKPTDLNPGGSRTKERIDVIDEENKIFSYSYIEGEILKHYKNLKGTAYMSSSSSKSKTNFKFIVEFDKANAQVPHPHFFKDFLLLVFNDLDAYLLNA